MFVFLFEHVKLRSIIIIGATNERCSACFEQSDEHYLLENNLFFWLNNDQAVLQSSLAASLSREAVCMKYVINNVITIIMTMTHGRHSQAQLSMLNPFTLRVSLESVVCYSHTFENIFWIKQKFTKYLKESSCLACDQHFSFKCFQENVFVS